jgi:hypothetical protein
VQPTPTIWSGDETQVLATILAIPNYRLGWTLIGPFSSLMNAQAIHPWRFTVGSIPATTLDRNLSILDTE